MRFDYTTIGHVTVDVLEDGSRQAGGAAFYSALQAARLGLRTLILTRGVAAELEGLLEPYRDELELNVLPAAHTTTLHTRGSGSQRSQRVLAWAGPIEEQLTIDTAILHLAPVARESPGSWRGHAEFVGLTPQGLVRGWSRDHDSLIEPAAPPASALTVAASCNAIVVSQQERASCASLIAAASAAGALVAVTDGACPNTIITPGGTGQALQLDVPHLEAPVEDLGAGDVFAAALFIALYDGRTAVDAASFANAAAAVRMSASGAQAIGDRAAIEQRLSSYAS